MDDDFFVGGAKAVADGHVEGGFGCRCGDMESNVQKYKTQCGNFYVFLYVYLCTCVRFYKSFTPIFNF
ncbi:hypothetical protein HanIR_Chr09g0418381 [Helianthus annuus]|nr:hypothetical protein HanIR_Chr09g0418381 [Helianthus annuus]